MQVVGGSDNVVIWRWLSQTPATLLTSVTSRPCMLTVRIKQRMERNYAGVTREWTEFSFTVVRRRHANERVSHQILWNTSGTDYIWCLKFTGQLHALLDAGIRLFSKYWGHDKPKIIVLMPPLFFEWRVVWFKDPRRTTCRPTCGGSTC